MSASTERRNRQAAREAGVDRKLLADQEQARKAAKSKRKWILGTIAIVLFIALVIVLNSSLLYKTTAYTVGDTAYSASELGYEYASQYNYFLSQYGSYASMFGIDTSMGLAGLRSSQSSFSEGTWRDYFLDSAKSTLLQTTALVDYANENGITLDEDETSEVETSINTDLDSAVSNYGYSSADKYLAANYGSGVNKAVVLKASLDSSLASKVTTEYSDSLEYTEAELKDEYASYEGAQDIFDYAYYYVAAATTDTTDEEGNASTEVTEEALAESESIAKLIESAYNDSEGDDYLERLNAAVASQIPDATATEQSAVSGSSLSDYKDWMLDESRVAGDIAVTAQASGSGYYVTVFMSRDNNDYPTVSVRHILVKAVASEDGTYSDEAKAEAKARADEILAEWKSGEKTEDSFAALANEYSEDGGSNTNGGLYENIYKNSMVENFDAFCFGDHKPGDTDVIYGESASYAGYHVMYFVGEGENYCDYIARNQLASSALESFVSGLEETYTTSDGFGLRLVG